MGLHHFFTFYYNIMDTIVDLLIPLGKAAKFFIIIYVAFKLPKWSSILERKLDNIEKKQNN